MVVEELVAGHRGQLACDSQFPSCGQTIEEDQLHRFISFARLRSAKYTSPTTQAVGAGVTDRSHPSITSCPTTPAFCFTSLPAEKMAKLGIPRTLNLAASCWCLSVSTFNT